MSAGGDANPWAAYIPGPHAESRQGWGPGTSRGADFGKGAGASGKGKGASGPSGKGKGQEPQDARRARTEQRLTALGLLQALGDPRAPLLAHTRLMGMRRLATTDWGLVQGGWWQDAEDLWREAFEYLELDADAVEDLMLLAAQGVCGRAEANEILWSLLTHYGVETPLRDLSSFTSNRVTLARRAIDMPPRDHPDMQRWSWRNAYYPRHPEFSPTQVPRDRRSQGDPQGRPLKPPACWVPPPPPPAPQGPSAASAPSGAASSSGAPTGPSGSSGDWGAARPFRKQGR